MLSRTRTEHGCLWAIWGTSTVDLVAAHGDGGNGEQVVAVGGRESG